MSDDLLTLFDQTGPLVRASDPRTSRIAAEGQTPARLGPIRAAVLLALDDHQPLCDGDLWALLGGPESSARKRRGELATLGLVESVGETVTPYGKPSLLWALTDAGVEYVRTHRGRLIEQSCKRKRTA